MSRKSVDDPNKMSKQSQDMDYLSNISGIGLSWMTNCSLCASSWHQWKYCPEMTDLHAWEKALQTGKSLENGILFFLKDKRMQQ